MKPDWFALGGVAVSIGLHLVLDAQRPCLLFIVGCCLFWIGFSAWRVKQNPGVLRVWGFRRDNLQRASVHALLFFVPVATLLGGWGLIFGTLQFPSHFVLLLLLYPVWGLIQQFLALGIVVRSLETIPRLSGRPVLLATLIGFIFGLVHLNDWRVMLATVGLEIAFVLLYRVERNLIPLAIVHGWLGAMFYLWVLNVDLWRETFT